MTKILILGCFLTTFFSCQKQINNKASLCVNTDYKELCLMVPEITYSGYSFYNGENKGDLEGYQEVLFTYNNDDTANIKIYKWFINELNCNVPDSIIFRKHTLLINDNTKNANQLQYIIQENGGIKLNVTKYNTGAYISACAPGEAIRIELVNISDTALRDVIVSSISIK